MIHFDWPWVALLLPLPILLRLVLPPANRKWEPALYAPFATDIPDGGAVAGQAAPGWTRTAVFGIVWLLLLVAAAQPQWLGEAAELPETGRNLMLAVDVSGSMETPDLDPSGGEVSRLDVVKQVAGEFIARRSGDRVGLILFGSQAYVQSPLTFDRTTVRTLLNESLIGIAGKQTALGDAIGLAVKRMRDAPGERAVLVLLTDGASTAGRVSPDQAAALAARAGLTIHTIGVGAERMRVPSLFGDRVVNPSADLDEKTLRAIADTTGGTYFRATDREALAGVYA
ncbi:MAG: VWA domain-containing protein, partial [Pseudomonadota bacterium]|nr:VWA domain-containing protein [Pseudomonadota bacterium]